MQNVRWYKPTLYANEENITSSQDDISSTYALENTKSKAHHTFKQSEDLQEDPKHPPRKQ
jgi:hypothetical protein